MKRWGWSVLLLVAAMAAMTVGAAAATEVVRDGIKYDTATGTVLGPNNQANITSAKILSEVNGTKITAIADDAFSKCSNLKTVEITSGIETIGSHAFSGCSALETIYFSNTVKEIGSFAFSSCGKLNNVILPSQLNEIKQGTFSGCGKLTAIYLPATVTNIGSDAFLMTPQTLILHREVDTPFVSNDGGRTETHRALLDPQPVKPAGCVTAGEERLVVSCGTCNRVIIDQSRIIPATGHTQGAAVAEVPANCVEAGTTAGHLCTVCGKPADGLEVIPIDPNNHKTPAAQHVVIPRVEATCTKDGSENGKQCPDCFAVTTPPSVITAKGHTYVAEPVTVREATCSKMGLSAEQEVCSSCHEIKPCEACDKLKDNEEAYFEHLKNEHNGQDIPMIPHTPGESKYVVTREPACEAEGEETWKVVCSVCGVACGDDPIGALDHPARSVPALGHDLAGGIETITKQPTCTEPGTEDISAQACKREGCGYKQEEQKGVEVAPLGHDLTDPVDKTNAIAATCKEEGEDWLNFRECKRDGCDYEEKTVVKKKGAHNWGAPVKDPDPKDKDGNPVEDKDPTCGDEGAAYVIVVCSVCGETEHRKIELPATGKHNYEGSEWTIVKNPTATEDGLRERPCMNPGCTHKDSQVIPATGGTTDPDNPDNPDNPDKPTDPDNPSTPEETTYKVDVVQASNGTTTVSRSTAKAGDLVTVTVSPSSGYVLDMIRVIGGSQLVSLTNLGNNQYRFTMPSANVEVRATYDRTGSDYSGNWTNGFGNSGSGDRSDPRRTTDVMPVQIQEPSVGPAGASERLFQDIPTNHWAAGEINWASQMGYMNGTGNRFNPDGAISQQQMWMVLARLTGNQPANMAEARRWAELGGYADGSSPTGPVKRHQLVTALYRCARLSGRAGRTTTSLAGYPDSRTVPAVAREAFTWALSTGVVSGDAEGRLKPNESITRAQFAVILYRYSTRT